MHHTKDKGDLGVAKVFADLVSKGFLVLLPQSEHSSFDLVAYKDSRFIRVQVKARNPVKGALQVPARTCWNDKNGTHMKRYNMEEIDFFAVYDLQNDVCYYIETSLLSDKSQISLRVDTPKNNQTIGVRWAKDYRDVV